MISENPFKLFIFFLICLQGLIPFSLQSAIEVTASSDSKNSGILAAATHKAFSSLKSIPLESFDNSKNVFASEGSAQKEENDKEKIKANENVQEEKRAQEEDKPQHEGAEERKDSAADGNQNGHKLEGKNT
jgi:hypothetical protein